MAAKRALRELQVLRPDINFFVEGMPSLVGPGATALDDEATVTLLNIVQSTFFLKEPKELDPGALRSIAEVLQGHTAADPVVRNCFAESIQALGKKKERAPIEKLIAVPRNQLEEVLATFFEKAPEFAAVLSRWARAYGSALARADKSGSLAAKHFETLVGGTGSFDQLMKLFTEAAVKDRDAKWAKTILAGDAERPDAPIAACMGSAHAPGIIELLLDLIEVRQRSVR